ncbi:Putative receptor protein kinase ZmPK1 [Linum perenne]
MKLQTSKAPIFLILLPILILFPHGISSQPSNKNSQLWRGSSLSVESHKTDFLISPDKTFTCGFYSLGQNAYWFSIWFTNSTDRAVVWTANRDRPVNAKGSELSFRPNSALVLTDVDRFLVWETNTSSTDANLAELLNTGNLVLKNPAGKILWQSFDSPTDTLLPTQLFKKRSTLVSKLGQGNYGSGYFSFFFDNDNVLRMIYDGPDVSSIYWPNPDFSVFQNKRTNYNSSRIAELDEMGNFVSSDRLLFSASDVGHKIKRRLTVDYDGNLRLYSLNISTGSWVISWQAISNMCSVHGICGRNGICVYTPVPKCSCAPGYEVRDPKDWSKGCKPLFKKECLRRDQVKFVKVPHVDFWGFDLNFSQQASMETCRDLCLYDCQCDAFSYRLNGEGSCYTKSMLFNGYQSIAFPGNIYLKLPVSFNVAEASSSRPAILNGSDIICGNGGSNITIGSPSMYEIETKKVRWVYLYSFACSVGVIEILLIAIGWWFLHAMLKMPTSVEMGYHAIASQFRRFSYAELKKATNNFKEELGRGGSGVVYKGVLGDERVVAVKRLGDSYQGEDVFWAEVTTIGKINHMNLVRMWGFCAENRHRILVYEYLKHQSLDNYLFSNTNSLEWQVRFKVALGTAKGLAYLHHECLEWVIHCDVKPENILLDDDFEPKIADFGLAKLSRRDSNSSQFTKIRGTKGYMAPEWASNLPITAKVDVYSYGVVILELVKGIRLSYMTEEDEEAELARFIRMAKRKIMSGEESWIDEQMVDPKLKGKFSHKQAERMVEIGLSCVDEDRNKRPTMGTVVQSLLDCQDYRPNSSPPESSSSPASKISTVV